MQQYLKRLRSIFNSFKIFLVFIIKYNKYNKHAIRHFKYNVNKYIFKNNYEIYMQELTI